MKTNFIVQPAIAEEVDFIYSKIKEYNTNNIPLKKGQVVERICRIIKDSDGNIIAGIVGYIYHNFKSLYIDLLWAKEEFRKCNYGAMLLEDIEKESLEKGLDFVHLYTFGFQAKDFYVKKGYEVFATLDECALNNKAYYVKKRFNNMNNSLKINSLIQIGTDDDAQYINDRIIEYNSQQVPFTNESVFDDIAKVIKDFDGNVIAGIVAALSPWKDLAIHGMWANEDCMENELKVKLLHALEKELEERGGCLAIHETFDLKTKDFYVENGYEVYGILDEYPEECKTYYMKKTF